MDVVTDGFVKVLLNIHTFDYLLVSDAEKQLMGWIKKIMINCAIDELRRNNMLPEIGELTKELWETDSEKHTADQLLLYKDLVNLIKELPTNYRVIFNLYVIDGYSHSEIADKLKISVSTSRSGLSRARTILQTTIIKMEEGEACSI